MGDVIEILTTATNTVEVEAAGPQGIPGVGVPTGGSALQILRKKTSTDYDTEWAAAGSGSGSVTSVALASTDLTISGSPITDSGTITANIAANAVTLEKLQTISSEHLLGRHGSGNGGVQQVGLGTGLAMSGSNMRVATTGITAGTYTKLTVDETGRATVGATTTPSDIGAQSLFVTEVLDLDATGSTTLSASRAKVWNVGLGTNSSYNVTLPTSGHIAGDIVVIRAANIPSGATILIRIDQSTAAQLRSGQSYRYIASGASATDWVLVPVDTHQHTASDITSGTLAHERGGLEADVSAYNGLVKISGGSTSAVTVTSAGEALLDDADAAAQRTTLGLGTAATSASTDFAAASHTHTASAISDSTTAGRALLTAADAAAQRTSLGLAAIAASGSASDLTTGTVATARLGTGTANSGTFLRGDQTWAAAGGVTTGSVDNAVLRADGVGGSTSQSSDINIEDATTATANNVTISNQHSGQTNSSLVLQPKGTGAFVLGPKPDGTTTGGNARGSRAVDLQWEPRFAATMVASGTGSAILNGLNNTASGTYALAWGQSCTASGTRTTAGGFAAAASGSYCMALGWNVTTSGSYGAMALGARSVADRQGILAFASGTPWATNAGVAQNLTHVLWGKTTTNAAVELLSGDVNEGTVRLTVPSGRVMTGLLTIVGTRSDGSTVASYMRQVTIKNVGGTTSLVGTVNTVGTDEAGGTSISITANDTNDALKVEATGVASQIFRWVCTANMTEMTYGT